jgi:hypothetical protein
MIMNALIARKHVTAAALFACTLAPTLAHGQAPDSQSGQPQLKWTPHRAATATAPTGPAAPIATDPQPAAPAPLAVAAVPQAADSVPTGPASVSLPPDVPAINPGPRRVPGGYAPARSRTARMADAPSMNGIPAAIQRTFDPANPEGVFGMSAPRSPQGDVTRQILAPEGRQAVAMQRNATRLAGSEAERFGGGLAPRYQPTVGSASRRPERLAMNVDGIPSVMTQAPQVGGLDDTGVPGRTPPGSGAAERIATPEPRSAGEGLALPDTTIIEEMPGDAGYGYGSGSPEGFEEGMIGDEMMLGSAPPQLHVESFYDDPYECEDEEYMMCEHSGRICMWLRRFGKPYYGWRWYRDFTASAGVTAFENETNFGLRGNFGTNEYLNWAMPFWNAFGIGWQVGARGVQTNFQPSTVTTADGGRLSNNARNQTFVTSGFFTRAFEGRGLQGGAVYDYLSDNWYDTSDVSQIRSEISYVWGYHEFGYWGAHNIGDQSTLFGPIRKNEGIASTLDLYCGFYRLQFGDANEWKVWGGAVDGGGGIVGSMLRAPIARSWALEGTFTYVIPDKSKTVTVDEDGTSVTFAPSAWNIGLNLVYYPAGRSRRSLASPYRPLFDVADNGSMIRSLAPVLPSP